MSSSDKLRWIPLESNPEVFNKWAQRAGLITAQDSFSDVYGLDDDLLALVPHPTKAVILLFPDVPDAKKHQKEEDARISVQGSQPHLDPTIFYVRQKISNACGTIALIHALANSDVSWAPHSALHNFIIEGQEKTPEERAEILQNRTLFFNIHAESAQEGQSAANIDTDLHFTCFVSAPDAKFRKIASGEMPAEPQTTAGSELRLIELDGRRPGPIDHGACTDLLKDVANLVKQRYLSQTESVYFNLMSLGPTIPDD
ncbi:peptidase C12, ubiquitin carboxyl-terminal hydrolase 1 [Coprinopsis marcescibilis]|uniref:Ubiquitin carboxyl-terminal hydrolase n=1 Tax=Coprinopsis marcescibilis TaxID=230819 RepID=A0A5C3KUV6_COPMA|nr:peptidase C12, ubiquitin carboxyl-terminal hydrolase 1 [Coprinopsis marcescibilis]